MKKEMGIVTLTIVLTGLRFVVSEGTSPLVCRRPSYAGPCYARIMNYYWDQVNCVCNTFVYGGCQSNGNNFKSRQECMVECGRTPCTPTPEVCTRPKFPGKCTAYFGKWYWDFDECECKPLVYGGCQSNGNNFKTKADCMKKCQNSHCPKTGMQ